MTLTCLELCLDHNPVKSYENVKHFNTEKIPFFYVGT